MFFNKLNMWIKTSKRRSCGKANLQSQPSIIVSVMVIKSNMVIGFCTIPFKSQNMAFLALLESVGRY